MNFGVRWLDTEKRVNAIKDDLNTGLCNITKCCTAVCPEHIKITHNGAEVGR